MTRDPADTIRKLKEQSGKDIWLWGTMLVWASADVRSSATGYRASSEPTVWMAQTGLR